MTQTLDRERRQKFLKIIEDSELYSECDMQWNDAYLETEVNQLVDQLVLAARSRTEIQAEERPVKGIEAAMFAGRPVVESDLNRVEHNALDAFEIAFKLDPGNIAWFNVKPEWKRLRAKLVDKYQTDPDYFKKYHKWYTEEGKFAGGMNVQQMRRDPDGFVLALNIFEAASVGITQKTGRRMERLDR